MEVPLLQKACVHDLPRLQWDASKFSMTGLGSTFVVGIAAGRDFMEQQVNHGAGSEPPG